MMVLSRLILNPRSRQVRWDLGNSYELHRTIMDAFPTPLPTDERILFRVDTLPRTGMVALLVQSRHRPDWARWENRHPQYLLPLDSLPPDYANPVCKPVALQLSNGQVFGFRLRANPTKKKDGKRQALIDEKTRRDWLHRKLEQGGMRLLAGNDDRYERVEGTRQNAPTIVLYAVEFEGILQITEPALAMKTLQSGIGTGKGLGFGLLSLARVS